MNVMCCDDNSMHLSLIQSYLKTYIGTAAEPLNILGTYPNGSTAVKAFEEFKTKGIKVDVITCDISMPEMDGLSALSLFRSLDKRVKIVMASSEDEQTMVRRNSKVISIPAADRMALLEKVVKRVLTRTPEPGKLNSILDACVELHLNPIEVAQHLGANGYLHKPYKPENIQAIMSHVLGGGNYISKVG